MYQVPITYLFEFKFTDDRLRPYIMNEFAVNGAKHLVLSSTFIGMVMNSPSFAKQLCKEMEAVGMSFLDSHAPYGTFVDLNVPDPHLRKLMLERQRFAMCIAADMKVGTIVMHPGGTRPEWSGYSVDQLCQEVTRSLDELLPLAEELDLIIAIENSWRPTTTAERLLEQIEHFKSPHLGICYDSGHANLLKYDRGVAECAIPDAWVGYTPVLWDDKILEKVEPELVNCHLHDNNGLYDQHLIPGAGTVDWENIVAHLKATPKLKCIQCETTPVLSKVSISAVCKKMQSLFS